MIVNVNIWSFKITIIKLVLDKFIESLFHNIFSDPLNIEHVHIFNKKSIHQSHIDKAYEIMDIVVPYGIKSAPGIKRMKDQDIQTSQVVHRQYISIPT